MNDEPNDRNALSSIFTVVAALRAPSATVRKLVDGTYGTPGIAYKNDLITGSYCVMSRFILVRNRRTYPQIFTLKQLSYRIFPTPLQNKMSNELISAHMIMYYHHSTVVFTSYCIPLLLSYDASFDLHSMYVLYR